VTIYDSLGVSHEAQFYFSHVGSNQWRVFGLLDDEPIQFTVPGDTNTYDSLLVEFNGVGQINSIKGYGVNTDQSLAGETDSSDLGSFTLSNTPVLPGSLVITRYTDSSGTYTVNWIDDGHGNIIDLDNDNRVIGTISYDDGSITINQFAGNGENEQLTTGSYKTYDTTVSANTIPPEQISIVPIVTNNQNSATLNTGGNPVQFSINMANVKQLDSEFIFYAEQDGYAKGDLLSTTISEDGVVRGVYSNGQVKDIARIAVATFNDKEMLVRKGNNVYLPKANARTITTSDQLLQETMNLKR